MHIKKFNLSFVIAEVFIFKIIIIIEIKINISILDFQIYACLRIKRFGSIMSY